MTFRCAVALAAFLGVVAASAQPKPKSAPSAVQDTASEVEAPPPAPAAPAAPMTSEANSRRWRFALGAGYILGSNTEFDDVKISAGGNTVSGEAEFDLEQTFVIAIEGRYSPRQSWGFMGGLNYEGERKIEGGSVSGPGFQVTFGALNEKVQVTTLYGSAVYRWDSFYLPFGLNYSVLKYKADPSSAASVDEGGGIGAQLGVGWIFQDQFALELHSWVTTNDLKVTASTGTLDYGSGMTSNLVLVGKYLF